MKIFLAGASGAVGRALVPRLLEHGHEVVGTTRTMAKAYMLRELGAEPVILDALDRAAVLKAVSRARPDAIVHHLTAMSGPTDFRRIERSFAATNRLRTEGTDNLLAAAELCGVERVIAQSYTGPSYARTGGPVKTEDDPLDPDPPRQLRATIDALRHLEQSVTSAGGVVLRYAGVYGPGTGVAPGGDQWEMVRARRFPIVGDGAGVWSFTHVDDAATATVAALERWTPGEVYNIVDNEPARVREWLPTLADVLGAKPPRHVPRRVGLLMGAHLVALMCEARGASNQKARRMLGWRPAWPTWREGFRSLAAT